MTKIKYTRECQIIIGDYLLSKEREIRLYNQVLEKINCVPFKTLKKEVPSKLVKSTIEENESIKMNQY